MNPLELTKGDGLEPENDAGDPKEVDQEVEEACLSDVLKLRLSVHRTVTDLQADSRGLLPPFLRNFCRNDPICPEFFKEILKTLTQKAIYYTLSVTSWTRRRPQPLFPRGKKGEEIVDMANVYPMTVENNLKI